KNRCALFPHSIVAKNRCALFPHSIVAKNRCALFPHSIVAKNRCALFPHSIVAKNRCALFPHSIVAKNRYALFPHSIVAKNRCALFPHSIVAKNRCALFPHSIEKVTKLLYRYLFYGMQQAEAWKNLISEPARRHILLPADEAGGDFYDITFDGSGNLWLAVGDVSGHGAAPGLIMMMAQKRRLS
ncbi:hypothetical protein QUF76_11285, partial [Desulfobacterales bacterium HSG16]|nr:hypothetical protein [Desulfobacterales bacterium HSG16]